MKKNRVKEVALYITQKDSLRIWKTNACQKLSEHSEKQEQVEHVKKVTDTDREEPANPRKSQTP